MASKTLQSTIEISGVLSPSLQAAIKNAVSKLDEMSKETLESAGAAEKLGAEIGAQESVLKSLQKGYADYIVSGKESSDEALNLADNIKTLSDELDANKITLQAAEKAAKKLTETQDDSADAYTRLERKVSSQKDELAALRREYANVVLEQGKTSTEAKQLEGKISSLSGELDENEKQLRLVGKAAEEAGQKAEESSEGYTVLKNVIANLASEVISKAVEAFKELATEGDSALGMLEARTGATGEKIAGFEDVMYEVYNANYGESLGDVAEKLATVIQMTDDLDNASLAKVTKSAIALEDVFGFDVAESMRAVNSLMDQFGITSDQAFNLIVQGAQNGLNQNDDLLDTINEYSVQFMTAGYTADDMFNMLMNGAEAGTWSVDKLGDAVKEFNIRMSDGTANEYLEQLGVDVDTVMAQFNKGGPEAQKAIGAVMEAIRNCDDATLQYQTGVGLFGTMWEDLGADTVAALMDTRGAISSTSDAMAKMDGAAYDTLEASVSQLGRTIRAEVLQPIVNELTPALKGVVDFTTNNLPTVGVVIGGVTAAIAAFKIAAWSAKLATEGFTIATKLQAVAQGALNAVMNANPIGLIIIAVTALVAVFVTLWNNCEGFRNFWIGLWENIKNAVSVAVDWIKNCWEKIKAFFTGDNPIARYFQMGWNNIKIVWDTVVSYFKTIWENIKLVFSAVKAVFKGDFSGAWDAVKQIFANWGEFFAGLWDNVKKIFGNVGDFFGSIFSGAWDKIKNIFAPVGEFFSALWASVSTAFSNLWEKITSSPVFQWFSSLFNSIYNTLASIVGVVIGLLKGCWTIITTVFGIAATWFNENVITPVKNFFTGLWSAISGAASTAWNGIVAIWTTVSTWFSTYVTTPISNFFTSAWGVLTSGASKAWEGIKNIFSSVASFFGNIFSAAWEKVKGVFSAGGSIFSGIKDGITSVFKTVVNAIISGINKVVAVPFNAINAVLDKIRGISIVGITPFSGLGSISVPQIPLLASGGFTDGVSIAGEAGTEAVISFDPAYHDKNVAIWEKAGQLLGTLGNSTTGEPSGEGLTSKAGELLTLDNFSLGSLADGTNVVVYYDFSGFTWSPQIHAGGTGDNEDDLMARLRAHEAEFFDWLEEFIQMREVAQYA